MDPVKLKNLCQQLDRYSMVNSANGFIKLFSFDPRTGHVRKLITKHNLILYSGADIMAQCLSGNAAYAVAAMYLEFQNNAGSSSSSSSSSIAPPTFDRTGGVAYYNGLAGSPDRDYLRVPLTVNPSISASSALYTGNQITFFGVSEGTVGFNGKPFGESSNSSVLGAALVSTPDWASQASDQVFSRVYSGIDAVRKETGFEIGVTWTVRLT